MTAAEKALIEAVESAQKEIDALEAKIAEQSAIISGKTFHDVQEATARECAEIAINAGLNVGRYAGAMFIVEAIREKYNIKD